MVLSVELRISWPSEDETAVPMDGTWPRTPEPQCGLGDGDGEGREGRPCGFFQSKWGAPPAQFQPRRGTGARFLPGALLFLRGDNLQKQ